MNKVADLTAKVEKINRDARVTISAHRPIKEYCLGIYDGPHATPKESRDGPVFLGIKNITEDGRLDLTEIRHVSEEEFPRWTRRVSPQAGDLVFTYEATLHRYAVILDGFRGCLGRRVALIRPDTNKVDHRFLLYYFLSSAWQQVVESNVITGATVDRIPLEKFPEFPVSLPPLSLQQRVADILSAYDDLIENNRRRMKLLEESARQLYQEWFVRLRFPGHEHTRVIDGVPEGWEVGSLSDFYDTASGGTPKRINPDFFSGEILWVKTQELRNGFVIDTEEKITEEALKRSATKLFPERTVLVAMYGATIGQLGILANIAASNQACCAIMPRGTQCSFIYAFLFLRENKESLVGLSMGAAQNNINQQIIRTFPMMMPHAKIMRLFNDTLKPVFDQWMNLQYQYGKLQAARDLLLPRLMNGEIAA
jgi:type I restriction enzyme S subunit